MTKPTHIFVYGSLKSTHHNNRFLQGRTELVNGDAFLPGFNLYEPSWFPGIARHDNPTGVKGELYRIIDEAVLDALDNYEGYVKEDPARSLFLREQVEVDGVPAFTYTFNEDMTNQNNVPSGFWES